MTHNKPARYSELHTHSSHSLLDGVPTPTQLVDRASELGLEAIALTDHDALYGAVPFHLRARQLGLKAILGAEMRMEDGSHLTLLAENNAGYTNLCRLITAGRAQAEIGQSKLPWNILRTHTNGLICLTGCRRGPVASRVTANDLEAADRWLGTLVNIFGKRSVYVELQRHMDRDDVKVSRRLATLAANRGLPIVATGNVHYLTPGDGHLQSALVSIRERVALPMAGHLLRPNHEYFMRTARGMEELFLDLPQAITNTLVIAERCESVSPRTQFELPSFPTPAELSSIQYLRQLCFEQLLSRAPAQADRWHELLVQELACIKQLGLADYFLILWDIAVFCQRRGILYQSQGSAANTIVAKLLGLSIGDSIPMESHLECFASVEYGGAPEFELEIEIAQRDMVRQYIHERWGFNHIEAACRFNTFNSTSAIREAGFALDLNTVVINEFVEAMESGQSSKSAEPPANGTKGLFAQLPISLSGRANQLTKAEQQGLFGLAQQLHNRPRSLSANTTALLLTREPVADFAPIQALISDEQTVIQFDEAALEGLGIPHIHMQGTGMLSALAETLELVRDNERLLIDLGKLDYHDKAVYDLICSARTIGIMQDTPATADSLIPCIQPRSFQDLLVEVSLMLRPSQLRARMVQHYRQRQLGLEQTTYTVPLLQPALEETLGVVIFQEQALQIVREVAGFEPEECEAFRQALNSKDAVVLIEEHQQRFMTGAAQADVPCEIAEQIWNMLFIYAGYSYSKARAVGYATIIYWAAWLRLNYPAHYFCGQLRFVSPGTHEVRVLEAEAVRAGVKLLAFDVNRSKAKPTVEHGAIRMGLQHIYGVDEAMAELILSARGNRPFRSLADLIQRTGLERQMLEWLILAGALDSLGERPHVLWELAEVFNVARRPQPPMVEFEEVLESDFANTATQKVSVFASASNPARLRLTELRRDAFTKVGCVDWKKLRRAWVGTKVKTGGLVVTGPTRPSSADGAVRLRLAEPEGSIEVIVPADVYRDCREALRSAFLIVEGKVQAQGEIVTVVARRVQALA